MNTYTDRFGGQNVNPAMLSYVSVDLSAGNVTLVWPFQTGLGEDYAAAKIDVVTADEQNSLTLPDARLVSVGQDVLVNNVGASQFVLRSADGTNLVNVATGEQWFAYLTDNSTEAGTWQVTQFGMGVSDAVAGVLAGYGLYADVASLNQTAPYIAYNADQTFGGAARAGSYASTGGAVAFTFDNTATLGNGWFGFFRNDGSGSLTLTADGADTIDGSATKVLSLGESCIVISTGAGELLTFGYGRSLASTTAAVSIDISGNGDYVLSADEVAAVIQNYTGTLTGARTVTIGTAPGYFFVYNNTSGAFTTTFRVNGGDTGAVVTQGTYSIIRTDGTNATVAFSATSGTVTSVGTGTDLTGGPITTTGTIVHAASGVVAGTYGSASSAVTVTVNARGHITTITANAIAAAWAAITGIPAAISALGPLTPAADRFAYYTGASAAAIATITAYGRSFVAAASAAAARVLITPLTTNGDLWTYAGGIDARLAVGTNGQFLVSNGTLPGYRVLTASDMPTDVIAHNWLTGLTMSTAGGSANMAIAAGQAADSTNTVMMVRSTSITKTTASWAVGAAAGGLDTGAIANATWYHFYEIRRPDTSVVDVVFSLNAASPTLPTNYTQYRRIGSGLTDGSAHWVAFIQDGDRFTWLAPILDIDAYVPVGTSAILHTLASVPLGLRVQASISLLYLIASQGYNLGFLYVSDPSTTNIAPVAPSIGSGSSSTPLFSTASQNSVGGNAPMVERDIFVNTSQQLRTRTNSSGGSDAIYVLTRGWVDSRGKNG